jgi:photosystem II stability/assembly factor-like uncharacterized protein
LEQTHHIARIAIHPRDPDVVYVAAVGHLWGPNSERGVYKTTDGGDTWGLVLFVDEHTGATDLVMDPGDPETLFVAMYQRQRTGWGFNGGGPGSGIYRTVNGGRDWVELTNGLPSGDKGRIGLDIHRLDPNLIYALVEADARAPGSGFGGGGDDRETGLYRSRDRGETWEHLSTTNNRPMYYSQVWIDPNDQERIYLGGANLYRSSDGGRNFTNDAASGVHLDHHALWIDPANSDHMILGSDGGVSVTWDRGESWRQFENLPLAQFYEIGVDMRDPYHVCGGLQDNGSWCGPSDTRSNQGIRTKDWYNVGGGDGFYTVMHPSQPGMMLAESQGGNLLRVNLATMESARLRPVERPTADGEETDYRWNWDTPVAWSSHDPSTVYLGGNFLFKSTDLGQTWQVISPDLTKQVDREQLEIMSVLGSEPMMSPNDGISSYGNLTTISESPLNAGLIYVGTDDGNVQVTQNGGESWTDLTGNFPDLPDRTYVSRVVASAFDVGTVYATFDGHRNDDFAAYVYRSTNHGQAWSLITNGLPESSVNVIAQHPRAGNLVFLGNEVGVYFSIDRGESWSRLRNNMPTVPVDDIVVHPRENDLVIGTHGRGIFIMDDIGPLESMSREILAADLHLFPVRRAISYNLYTPQGWTPSEYQAPNPQPGAHIRYYLRSGLTDNPATATDAGSNGDGGVDRRMNAPGAMARIQIVDATGGVVRELEGPGEAGLQEVIWDLRMSPPYEREEQQGGGGGGFFGGTPEGPRVLPGTYTARIEAGGPVQTTSIEVILDPRVEVSNADLTARHQALMSAYRLAKPMYDAGRAVQRLTRQLGDVLSLLREAENVPEDLVEQVEQAQERVRELGSEIDDAGSGARRAGVIERSTTRPTADQFREIDRAWEDVPGLIEELNGFITDRVPAIYRRLNDLGIRPDPGEVVPIPIRR